jgi:hypothetical protein
MPKHKKESSLLKKLIGPVVASTILTGTYFAVQWGIEAKEEHLRQIQSAPFTAKVAGEQIGGYDDDGDGDFDRILTHRKGFGKYPGSIGTYSPGDNEFDSYCDKLVEH